MSMYEEHLCSYSSVERCYECEDDEECNDERIKMINIFNIKYGEALAPTLVREENMKM